MNLVNINRLQTAKTLLDHQPELREKAIKKMSNTAHAKSAASLVKDYKMNPEDFPEL